MNEIIRNARIVLDDEVIVGNITVTNGVISNIANGELRTKSGVDFDGDYLLPGLVDIHSDNIEKHISPRPNVTWPSTFAAMAHDADVVGVGITTILDAISLSNAISLGGADGSRTKLAREIIDGIRVCQKADALKAEHLFHIRCELTDVDMVDRIRQLGDDLPISMFTLVDHTPGQRVFRDIGTWRNYRKKGRGLSDSELDRLLDAELDAQRRYAGPNRLAIAAIARERKIALAGHDDSSVEDINEAAALGSSASEFPTTIEAARLAHSLGMKTIMGAPNLVRGKSHLGNVSAQECAEKGVLDILASDYVPVSLLQAAFMLTSEPLGYALPQAIATVTSNPASACGLTDRGRISIGSKADLIRVRYTDGLPVLRCVWRSGVRVH
ncbi:alpha-D-ribose 1-methylphosphonate 5-triphosphate diphosphatase [Bradyrhizobium sp. CCBAU 53421]|uniref:alpha-D-ribose 1-methylphosphonate 5-triphosphate diphosphatase n=1 Tax=Bradyrhizobium sp. CCBAU 53421 TaxID=1325120 RepID=UPI001889EC77|nr:alpha-D-ribose 1-methylphosphonate 5-triphosphate diphosphatase [Bradyrhizobium sp. CCBAU 53421]QOZ33233.1 phosphonate metabolism protein PhnM [Bradyrhizobium sp. CCBAU 53421]